MKKILCIFMTITLVVTGISGLCFGDDGTETSQVKVQASVSTSFDISESINITGGTYNKSLKISNLVVTNLTKDKTVTVSNIRAMGSEGWTAVSSAEVESAAMDEKYINLSMDKQDLTTTGGYDLTYGAVAAGATKEFALSGTIAYQTQAMTDTEVANLIVTITVADDTSSDGTGNKYLYNNDGSYNIDYLKTVTWSDGTNEEVAAVIAAIDAGDLDPEKDLDISSADAWGVGAERTIDLPAIDEIYGNSAYAEQSVTFVIMDVPGSDACNTKKWIDENGKKRAASFIIGAESPLSAESEKYPVWPTTTFVTAAAGNETEIDLSWDSSTMREWCNGLFYLAMLEAMDVSPNDNFFKKVSNSTIDFRGSTYSNIKSSVTVSYDYFAFPALGEICGSSEMTSAEDSVVERFAWFDIEYEGEDRAFLVGSLRTEMYRTSGSNTKQFYFPYGYVYVTKEKPNAYALTGYAMTYVCAPFGCL